MLTRLSRCAGATSGGTRASLASRTTPRGAYAIPSYDRDGASSVVLPDELARRTEVALASQRALRQGRAEVFSTFVGEPRRGRCLVPDQPLIGTWLEQVSEAAPGDDQR